MVIMKLSIFASFSDQVKIVHFIGAQKPWYYTYNRSTGRISSNISQHESSYLNEWWRVFTNHVHESLGDDFVSFELTCPFFFII
jgi:lipopolysaccharide biosynthesis glycosyltransferase